MYLFCRTRDFGFSRTHSISFILYLFLVKQLYRVCEFVFENTVNEKEIQFILAEVNEEIEKFVFSKIPSFYDCFLARAICDTIFLNNIFFQLILKVLVVSLW